LAAIEHMMRGRLVIASRIGGLGEVVGGAGLTCSPGDAGDLAREIQRVCRNPGLIKEKGALAKERARNLFLRKRMIEDHERVYGNVLQRESDHLSDASCEGA